MSPKPIPEWLSSLGLGVLGAALLVGGWFFFAGTASAPKALPLAAPVTAPPAATVTSTGKENLPPAQLPQTAAEPIEAQLERDPVAALAKLAATDPAQALAEALRETDPERRQRLIKAVLKAWAAVEPDAAARAALTWPGNDRVEPIAAVLEGVAGRPDDALRLGTLFCREDPAWAPEHGRAVIDALARAGAFSAAVSFALVGGAELEGEERNKWLGAAFGGWAQREPQLAALAATSDLSDAGMQQEALIAVVANWRRTNPQGPEKFLAQLPAGPERTALAAALAATSGPSP